MSLFITDDARPHTSCLSEINANKQSTQTGKRRSALSMSVLAALLGAGWPDAAFPATFDQVITGVREADSQYDTRAGDGGELIYKFQDGDTIATATDKIEDIYAVNMQSGSAPAVFQVGDNGDGLLNISSKRAEVGAWGTAMAINVEQDSLTVNGATSVYAQSDDATPLSSSIGIRIYQSTAIFNGDTTIKTSTPGYSQGLWVYQGDVAINGDTAITAQARGESTTGIYNSGGGRSSISLNGDASITAYGIWPSDNVHGIYNNNANSKLFISGSLDMTATSNGSTVFGIRNQGQLSVGGDATIVAGGPRSAFGIANTYRTAQMRFDGDVAVSVVNSTGYTPWGLPSAIENVYGRGASINFAQGVKATIGTAAQAHAIHNNGIINFLSESDTVMLSASSTCDGCLVYGVRNIGGLINFAGGLDADVAATGAGTAYLIHNIAADGLSGEVRVNKAGQARVSLDGDIVTGSVTNGDGNTFDGITDITLSGDDAYLRGRVLGYQDPDTADALNYHTGATTLNFAKGASWIPTGGGEEVNDFGSGGLTLGAGGIIDMASGWGAFSPGSVPDYRLRTLQIDSSTGNAAVTIEDGAKILLLSDIRNGQADKIVFGGGIARFDASGTQHIGVVYDPVLDDASWVNETTLQTGKQIDAAADITVIDASQAAGGTASLNNVAGLEAGWSQNYENDLVAFTYTPTLERSEDGSQVRLTGINIHGNGSVTASAADVSALRLDNIDDASIDASNIASNNAYRIIDGGIRPSATVLTAADAADSLLGLWIQSFESARLSGSRAFVDADAPHVWINAGGSQRKVDTAYARHYRQDIQTATLGGERRIDLDKPALRLGASITQGRSTSRYEQGRGNLASLGVNVYGGVVGDRGGYLRLGAGISRLRNNYHATDSERRYSAGTLRANAFMTSIETGYPFQLSQSLSLQPQASIATGVLQGDRHQTSTGVSMEMKRTAVTIAKAGATLAYRASGNVLDHEFYLRALRTQTYGGDIDVVAAKNGGRISPHSGPSHRGGHEITFGTSMTFNQPQLRMFIEIGRERSSGVTGDWTGVAGIHYRW
ncbi:autotransporter outer membrane beta-barrel domain-containing protein [Brenneria izadpanahii]|uniref:Autotransporter outer membrane beta-barrel domain-containing protein n=1 Tax=Brenneria izadpanahii TaxID=2722756 RepID=A0ABX7URR2_9GAMM|nr:autotransporter outer membrane beta-barrel domain-containing protein [Brenneria izadpanahii]QTF08423.1 autotransporter outer membrane beta-barrel domain-containing protein [Brenneria izadpanahii]